MNPPQEEVDQTRWFAEQVQQHEPLLRAWLRSKFPSLVDIDDVIQETYVRLLRAKKAGNVVYAKALLFVTARNLALDIFRHKRNSCVEDVTYLAASSVIEDRPGVTETVNRAQELEILTAAVQALPDRCRQIVLMRYHDGTPYKMIAHELGISTETVKTQLAKGLRRCAEYFEERGLLN